MLLITLCHLQTFPRVHFVNQYNVQIVLHETFISLCFIVACGSRQEADLMFILDSINAGKKNTKKALAFIQDLVNDLDVDKEKIQVGLMAGDVCETNTKSSTGFDLGAMKTKEDALDALTDKQNTDFGGMIKRMRRGAFSHRHGGRREARKIAILIVDGNLDEPLQALSEAKRARIHGIEVYVVQVGEDQPQEELMMMSDSPFRGTKNFFKVRNYNELKELKKNIWDSLCDGQYLQNNNNYEPVSVVSGKK